MSFRKNIIGRKFGKLTVIRDIPTDPNKNYKTKVEVQCDCGVVKTVIAKNIIAGTTVSCGCHKREQAKTNGMSSRFKTTHGKSRSKVYSTWRSIINRCYNEKNASYEYYGGRGITVCDQWMCSFDNFFRDMGDPPSKNHSIDRIDNNKNYDPTNCRWATPIEQGSKKRNNINVEINGVTKTVSQWCRVTGIDRNTAYVRIKKGMSPQEAVTIPLHQGKRTYIRKNK